MQELGQGGFGKVMLGRHKEEKKEVAIKFMDISESCILHPVHDFSVFGEYHTRYIQRG